MPNAKNIIKVSRNKDGKVIVKLYGQEHDITGAIKDGKAEVVLYGQKYEVTVSGEVMKAKQPAKKKKVAKDNTKDNEIGFIETPIDSN